MARGQLRKINSFTFISTWQKSDQTAWSEARRSGFHGWTTVDISSINYRGFFLDYWWLLEDPLKLSFDEARDDSGDYSTAQHHKVFGYWDLGWVQYNTKPEWPP